MTTDAEAEDTNRMLAYDRVNNVYILKLDSTELNTVRNSLRSAADFMRDTKFHNQDADALSVRIEDELKKVWE